MRRLFLAIAASSFFASSAPAQEQYATRTRLLTSPNASNIGQAVTLTAEVDGVGGGGFVGSPVGFVYFYDGPTFLDRMSVHSRGVTGVIAAGAGHTCVLTSDSGVKCWGLNSSGQLGDGTTITRLVPTDVSGLTSGVVAISAGARHSCAVTEAGGVKCWGANNFGQLGDGTAIDRRTAVDVSGLSSSIIAVAVGDGHSCALTKTGAVQCWGLNSSGQLGDGATLNRRRPVGVSGLSSGVTAIATGAEHTCALNYAYSVTCWGKNARGQIGDGTVVNRPTPTTVASLRGIVLRVTAGGDHNCAWTTHGARCWGRNDFGQLGDGSWTDRHRPVPVHQPLDEASGYYGLFAGRDHTCGLNWNVHCWGKGFESRPSLISGIGYAIQSVAAGGRHTCAVYSVQVLCWGDNSFGQIGNGSTRRPLEPSVASGVASLQRTMTQIKRSDLAAGTHILRSVFISAASRSFLRSSATATQFVRGADDTPWESGAAP